MSDRQRAGRLDPAWKAMDCVSFVLKFDPTLQWINELETSRGTHADRWHSGGHRCSASRGQWGHHGTL